MNDELVLHSSGRDLAGRIFLPSDRQRSGAGILFIHGAGSDQSGYHRRATAASQATGAICLTFDLGGHGGSAGSAEALSLRDHLQDCIAAFDALAGDHEIDLDRIGVCGASYGGYLASLLTSRRGVRSLLLRAPALYPDRDFDLAGGPRRSSVQTPESAASLRALRDYDGRVLILESERDEIIPHDIVEAYLGVCRHARHEVIVQAGHQLADASSRSAFVDIIVEWFGDTLAHVPKAIESPEER